jgi:hypothetical protein
MVFPNKGFAYGVESDLVILCGCDRFGDGRRPVLEPFVQWLKPNASAWGSRPIEGFPTTATEIGMNTPGCTTRAISNDMH